MLTDATLNLMSGDFRRGYRDGYAKRERNFQGAPDAFNGRPFARSDYDYGYAAGANDRQAQLNLVTR